jgi:DNA-binding NarL/FixJ family response regulator
MKNPLNLETGRMARADRQHGSLNCDALSPRECQVMLLAADGFANKTIAQKLKVTEGTVKIHLHRIYQKLGIKSRFSLAVRARELPAGPNLGEPSDSA